MGIVGIMVMWDAETCELYKASVLILAKDINSVCEHVRYTKYALQ